MNHVRDIPYNTPVNQEIARAVLEVIRKHGISQNEMARRIGVTSGRIARMMRGRADFSVITMQRVCNAFRLRIVVRFDPEVDDSATTTRANLLTRSVGGNDTPVAVEQARTSWNQSLNEGESLECGAAAARRAVEGFSDAAREAVERDLQELIAIELAAEQELLAAEQSAGTNKDPR